MADYEQVIIGAGASAIVFAAATKGATHASLNFGNEATQRRVMVGQEHLWQLPNPDSKAGQPEHLHQFPATPAKSYDNPLPTGTIDSFRTSGSLGKELEDVKRGTGLEVKSDKVERLEEGPPVKIYLTGKKDAITADQVIVCVGPGPERLPEESFFDGAKKELESLHYKRGDENSSDNLIFTALEFLPPSIKFDKGTEVLVYGGGATAAWVVEKLLNSECNINWLARPKQDPKEDPFAAANPAGRNQKVMDATAKLRMIGKISKIKKITDPKTQLYVKFSELALGDRHWTDWAWCWDKMVCALGTDVKQPGSAFSICQGIKLRPYNDVDRVFADWTNSEHGSILALRNDSGSIWVIGAAVARNFGNTEADAKYFEQLGLDPNKFKRASTGKYSDIGWTLPAGNRLVEVLGELTATIEAVTNYMPDDIKDRVNYNTANRNQLAVHLASHKVYGEASALKRNLIVRRIIEERSKKDHVFGLTLKEADTIIAQVLMGNYGLQMEADIGAEGKKMEGTGKEYLVNLVLFDPKKPLQQQPDAVRVLPPLIAETMKAAK